MLNFISLSLFSVFYKYSAFVNIITIKQIAVLSFLYARKSINSCVIDSLLIVQTQIKINRFFIDNVQLRSNLNQIINKNLQYHKRLFKHRYKDRMIMKNRTKLTKASQSIASLQNKKSKKKISSQTKPVHSMSKGNNQCKKTSQNFHNQRYESRILSVGNRSVYKHNLSQSQLNNQSIIYNQKDAKTNHTKTKVSSYSSRKSKQSIQIRSNLLQTFKLLQQRLKISGDQKPEDYSTLGLSKSIYEIIKNSTKQIIKPSGQPTMNSFNNSGFQANKENIQSHNRNENIYLHKNPERKHPGHSSHSSSLLQYFQEKFGGTNDTKDQQALQKKMKVLQVLKRSQQAVSKCSSHYNISLNSGQEITTIDLGGKEHVRDIMREKAKKN